MQNWFPRERASYDPKLTGSYCSCAPAVAVIYGWKEYVSQDFCGFVNQSVSEEMTNYCGSDVSFRVNVPPDPCLHYENFQRADSYKGVIDYTGDVNNPCDKLFDFYAIAKYSRKGSEFKLIPDGCNPNVSGSSGGKPLNSGPSADDYPCGQYSNNETCDDIAGFFNFDSCSGDQEVCAGAGPGQLRKRTFLYEKPVIMPFGYGEAFMIPDGIEIGSGEPKEIVEEVKIFDPIGVPIGGPAAFGQSYSVEGWLFKDKYFNDIFERQPFIQASPLERPFNCFWGAASRILWRPYKLTNACTPSSVWEPSGPTQVIGGGSTFFDETNIDDAQISLRDRAGVITGETRPFYYGGNNGPLSSLSTLELFQDYAEQLEASVDSFDGLTSMTPESPDRPENELPGGGLGIRVVYQIKWTFSPSYNALWPKKPSWAEDFIDPIGTTQQ